ncbi:hypothetical protein NEOLI_004875 [Neolecta irregularis DAH-3]|uniref:Ubiquitin 3 binding protein But2 C-terminal domain-containing protein n=1 Tax=Neolecta irregularis (strain DAH-3) TaxID=1198029 RepID=A0A1U7LNS1_NEOID|nr:hypothetical protein NEOLI_004875 [Neolecta irregularis DAH-3]|eukprot:OLL24305.1 hypothetical protein NEOLI_004875 [Neolecta irregularis DAH-3]
MAVASPTATPANTNIIYPVLVPLDERNADSNLFGASGSNGLIASSNGNDRVYTLASFDIDKTKTQCTLKFVITENPGQPGPGLFGDNLRFDVWAYQDFDSKTVTWNNQGPRGDYYGRIYVIRNAESSQIHFQCASSSISLLLMPVDNDVIGWVEQVQPLVGLIMTQAQE